MAYIIPEARRAQMQAQAKAAELPYTTILEQHIYDLQGLASVLTGQIELAKKAQSVAETHTTPPVPPVAAQPHPAQPTDVHAVAPAQPQPHVVQTTEGHATVPAQPHPAQNHTPTLADLTHQLAKCQDEIAALQAEQKQHANPS